MFCFLVCQSQVNERCVHPGSCRGQWPTGKIPQQASQGRAKAGYPVPGKSKEDRRQGSQQGWENLPQAPTPSPEMCLRGLASWRSLLTLPALSVLAEACFVGQRCAGSDGEWCGLWRTVAVQGIREMKEVSQRAVGMH